MKIYTAKEVIELVEGLNSEKTLKRWTNFVKENMGSNYFQLENLPFNRVGNRRPVHVYSPDDIIKFQSVAYVLSTQPRNQKNLREAIRVVFTSDTLAIKPKEPWEVPIKAIRDDLEVMCDEDKRLLRGIQEINRRLEELEDKLEIVLAKKPHWFRSKGQVGERVGGAHRR